MAGPARAMAPTEEMGLPPVFRSELANIQQKYGLELTRTETAQIVTRAMAGTKTTTPPEARERLEKALLSYVRSTDPARAYSLYNQMEGRKFWEHLGVENTKIRLGERELTVGAALSECVAEPDATKRLSGLLKIICEIAEEYRLLKGEGENSFGVKYSILASSPADITSKNCFNCFSAAMALGQMTAYAAGRVGLVENVKPKLQLVASHTINGKTWNDTGHAMLRLDITLGKRTQPMFFDPMNDFVPRHETQFAFNSFDNTIILRQEKSAGFGASTMSYRLNDALAITPSLVAMSEFQDKLFEGKLAIENPSVRAEIANLPPVFATYYATNMDSKAQRSFFKNYDFGKVQRAAMRYQLATLAANSFAETNPAKAMELGKIALSSLRELTTSDMSELVRLPMGGFLGNTARLAALMQQSEEGRTLLFQSRMWIYLPIVAASTDLSKVRMQDAEAAVGWLANFYNTHPKTLSAEAARNPTNLLSCSVGLLSLGNRVNLGPTQQKALDNLYGALGIDRQALLNGFSKNGAGVQPMGMSAAEVSSYLRRPSAIRDMEVDFLRLSVMVFPNEAGLKFSEFYSNLGARIKVEAGVSLIHWTAIYETLANANDMSKIALASGPLADGFRQVGMAPAVKRG